MQARDRNDDEGGAILKKRTAGVSVGGVWAASDSRIFFGWTQGAARVSLRSPLGTSLCVIGPMNWDVDATSSPRPAQDPQKRSPSRNRRRQHHTQSPLLLHAATYRSDAQHAFPSDPRPTFAGPLDLIPKCFPGAHAQPVCALSSSVGAKRCAQLAVRPTMATPALRACGATAARALWRSLDRCLGAVLWSNCLKCGRNWPARVLLGERLGPALGNHQG